MPDPTSDSLEPLIQRWLQSDDPDALLEQLCRVHPEHEAALRSRCGSTRADEVEPDAPTQVGPYRILDVLGEGGMGTVFLAEQREPVRRRVALKLIKLGMDSKAVVRRFEQERQALALMDHEGIAKAYDCGTNERGQPYFVMELVKGVPLDTYCEQQRLSLAERLQLMQQVCAAVQHAHQKGVIHRDLKPGNVLVSDLDGRLQIKIIDFGLAKAVGKRLIEESLFTELGSVIGTPEYMAPEQADPTNLDVDTRADVYSLGVMLYQLLVGQLPFSSAELRAAGMLEMQRVLREVGATKPSTKLTTAGDHSTKMASQLRVSPSALKKALKSDLDWVVVKALEKDRSRRYESASEFAADLQRFLAHEPLQAGPPSAIYRLQKLVRRNRGKFAAAALVLVALLLGGVGTYVQWQRAEEQRARAEAEAAANLKLAEENEQIAAEKTQLAASETAAKEAAVAALGERDAALQEEKERSAELEAVAQFQQDQFAEIDADLMGLRLRDALRGLVAKRCEARGLDAAATEAAMAAHDDRMRGVDFTGLALGSLDQNFFEPGLRVLDEKFADQPLLQARLRQTIATTLQELGRLELALKPQQQAVEVRRRMMGEEHQSTLTSVNNLGTLLRDQGRLPEAEPLLREALEVTRRVLGEEHPTTLSAMVNLGGLQQAQGKLSEAEPLLREALEAGRRAQGDEHRDTLVSMVNLGLLLQQQGKLSEAQPLTREALEVMRCVLGEEHPTTLSAMVNLGGLLQAQGKLSDAETLYREALEIFRRVRGDEHPYTLVSMNNLGGLLQNQGRLSDAESLLREALVGSLRLHGDEHPHTLASMNNLGMLLQEQGKLPEAEPLLRKTLSVIRRILSDEHPNTLACANNLGGLLQDQGKLPEAEPLLREALTGFRRVYGDRDAGVRSVLERLHACLVAMERSADARAVVKGFLDTTKLPAEHENVLAAKKLLDGLDDK